MKDKTMNQQKKIFIGTPATLFSNNGKCISFMLPLETINDYYQKVNNSPSESMEDFMEKCDTRIFNLNDFSNGKFISVDNSFYVAISNVGTNYIFN